MKAKSNYGYGQQRTTLPVKKSEPVSETRLKASPRPAIIFPGLDLGNMTLDQAILALVEHELAAESAS